MRAVMIIPARLGSTRLPEKLMLAETGRPLICHTVDAAVEACRLRPDAFEEVVVATDHPRILEAVNTYCQENDLPARAVMTRADHASGSDRIAEVAATLSDEVDAVVNLQGDEPEMDPQEILGLLELLESSGAEIATLCHPIRDPEALQNPNIVKIVCGADGTALYFSRAPIPYDRDSATPAGEELGLHHLGIYAYRRTALLRFVELPMGRLEALEKLEQLRALENGMRIAVGHVRAAPPKGIDTPEDYAAFVGRCPA